jgi:hypothetical protein
MTQHRRYTGRKKKHKVRGGDGQPPSRPVFGFRLLIRIGLAVKLHLSTTGGTEKR